MILIFFDWRERMCVYIYISHMNKEKKWNGMEATIKNFFYYLVFFHIFFPGGGLARYLAS
jgi:hypothetical protein